MALTSAQIKAVTNLLEYSNIPRLRKCIMYKVFSDLIRNKDAYTQKELDEIAQLYLFMESVCSES